MGVHFWLMPIHGVKSPVNQAQRFPSPSVGDGELLTRLS